MVKTAKLIRDARNRRKWTPAELARRLDATRSMIHAWENGGPGPRIDALPRISRVLGIPLDELLASRLAA